MNSFLSTPEFNTPAEAVLAILPQRIDFQPCVGVNITAYYYYFKPDVDPNKFQSWSVYSGDSLYGPFSYDTYAQTLSPDAIGHPAEYKKQCPTPLTRPEVPYTPDANGQTCTRPDNLTITLSGGTSVEPWHKKSDTGHTKTNLTYTATVKNSSGQAAPNIPVTITTEVTQDSGGHVHIDGRHKGKLAIPTDPIKDGKETISGNTDGNGVYSFTFGSEEASGTHTLTAKCTGCQAPATATVNVGIQGLSLLDRDPFSYTLNGEKSWHPGSHYFSAAAVTKILNLAFAYSHDPSFNKQLLIINDSSLRKGGVFDLGQDWTYTPKGHKGHRMGVVVDVNNYRDGPDAQFEEFASTYHIDAVWEGPDVTATPHYHLLLLGRDQ